MNLTIKHLSKILLLVVALTAYTTDSFAVNRKPNCRRSVVELGGLDITDIDEATAITLVQRIRKGDPEAEELLMAALYPRVRNYINHHAATVDPTSREDITQDTMMHLLQTFRRYPKPIGNFWSFFHTTVRNKMLDKIHDYNLSNQRVALVDPDKLAFFVRGGGNPEIAARYRELQDKVNEAILSLPEREREVVELHLQGLTNAEIMNRLSATMPAVDNALSRAKKQIRKVIEEE